MSMWHSRLLGASFPGGPVLPEVGGGGCPLHIFDMDVGGNVYFWKKRSFKTAVLLCGQVCCPHLTWFLGELCAVKLSPDCPTRAGSPGRMMGDGCLSTCSAEHCWELWRGCH